jgi:UDP-perosamine 4-acetyltransferase
MLESLVLIGAGGHARVLLDILRQTEGCTFAGVIDGKAAPGSTWLGIPVLGGDEVLTQLAGRGIGSFVIAIGSAAASPLRERLFRCARDGGLRAREVRHPAAIVAPSAQIGAGAQLLAGCVVNSAAILEENVIVNTRAIVEHDCRIGAHVHVATGAVLCGGVVVGTRSHIGAGAVVRQGIGIGADCTIGAGAVVVENVADGTTVAGNPARLFTPPK